MILSLDSLQLTVLMWWLWCNSFIMSFAVGIMCRSLYYPSCSYHNRYQGLISSTTGYVLLFSLHGFCFRGFFFLLVSGIFVIALRDAVGMPLNFFGIALTYTYQYKNYRGGKLLHLIKYSDLRKMWQNESRRVNRICHKSKLCVPLDFQSL